MREKRGQLSTYTKPMHGVGVSGAASAAGILLITARADGNRVVHSAFSTANLTVSHIANPESLALALPSH